MAYNQYDIIAVPSRADLAAYASTAIQQNFYNVVVQEAAFSASYQYFPASTATPDGTTVIQPSDNPTSGRWVIGLSPYTTQTVLTSGTTYTIKPGCKALRVRMYGGGGGGSGSGGGASAGSVGGNTSFNSIVANGGSAGGPNGGGAGGTGGAGSAFRQAGAPGGSPVTVFVSGTDAGYIGGAGGGNGGGSGGQGAGGGAGVANTGGGGGGAGTAGAAFGTVAGYVAAGGGGQGEYAEIIINVPSAAYTYAIGGGGAGGTAGSSGFTGGGGGGGIVIVDDIF